MKNNMENKTKPEKWHFSTLSDYQMELDRWNEINTKPKRIIDKYYKDLFKNIGISEGMKREFYKCNICGTRAANDYLPNSLSNPIYISPCEHDFKKNYIKF